VLATKKVDVDFDASVDRTLVNLTTQSDSISFPVESRQQSINLQRLLKTFLFVYRLRRIIVPDLKTRESASLPHAQLHIRLLQAEIRHC